MQGRATALSQLPTDLPTCRRRLRGSGGTVPHRALIGGGGRGALCKCRRGPPRRTSRCTAAQVSAATRVSLLAWDRGGGGRSYGHACPLSRGVGATRVASLVRSGGSGTRVSLVPPWGGGHTTGGGGGRDDKPRMLLPAGGVGLRALSPVEGAGGCATPVSSCLEDKVGWGHAWGGWKGSGHTFLCDGRGGMKPCVVVLPAPRKGTRMLGYRCPHLLGGQGTG